MAANILALPLLGFDMTVGREEAWLDSWAYLDASGNPISLAGLARIFEVRSQAANAGLPVFASTGTSINGLSLNGAVVPGSTVVTLQVATATMGRVTQRCCVHEMQA